MVALSSLASILGECSTMHSLPALKKEEVEINKRTLNPLFTPRSVHSGSVSWEDCSWMFPNKLYVGSFLDILTLCLDSGIVAHSNFVEYRVYACLGVTCHLRFWQNDWDLLHATAETWGWTDTEKESAHKVNSRKEKFPATPARIRTHNLSIMSLALLPTCYPGPQLQFIIPAYPCPWNKVKVIKPGINC